MNRSIDVRQLRYFVAVAQERSFRRAAERLHLTQPPLSRQVNELENALGARLLARDTRNVRLTPLGELALREFEGALRSFDRAVERVAAATPAAPPLRLGVAYWSDLSAFGAVEARLRRTGLVGGLEIQTAASHESIAAIRRGALDAALVAGPGEFRDLDSVVLGHVRRAAFVPARTALARRRSLRLADLEALPPFYRFRRRANPALYDHFERQFNAAGFAPREVANGPEAMGVFAQIAGGRGCTCMPDLRAGFRYAGVVRRPLRETVTMEFVLVNSRRLDPRLREILRRASSGLLRAPRAAA